jgi:SAM-dependent methyltransferase
MADVWRTLHNIVKEQSMAERNWTVCPACGSHSCLDLPLPHSGRAMVSDGRVIVRALRKSSCLACGYGFHVEALTADELRGLYDDSYDLGLRDRHAERARADAYASQIFSLLSGGSFGSVLEFGCGAGSLLSVLTERWQGVQATGVEPSAQLAAAALREAPANVQIVQGFAEDFATDAGSHFDLCLSVNVAEHALSPETFLCACGQTIHPGGTILLICPDGEEPGSELLFYDHISSFTRDALAAFARRAGLDLVRSDALAGTLSGFRAHRLLASEQTDARPAGQEALAARRASLMLAWQGCERAVERMTSGQDYAIFGTGEYADLLAAYCPSVVERAACFVVDSPTGSTCHGRPVMATADYLGGHRIALLAAVHERSWEKIYSRFSVLGIKVEHPLVLASRSLQ